jgi:hypothetical protein
VRVLPGVAFGSAVAVAALLAVAARAATAGPPVSGGCSQATAQRLEIDRVAGVLCGAFLGPGSAAMVASLTTGTCLPFVGWSVYALRDGAWQPVPLGAHGGLSGEPPVAVGTDIRETLDVRRAGDSLCNPTGGTRTRIWHWDGTRLTAGTWKQATAAAAPTHAFFNAPAGIGVQCGISDQPGQASGVGVTCQSVVTKPKLYQQKVTMGANGRPTICRDAGIRNRCKLGNAGEEKISTLGYGKQVTVGRFRCQTLHAGIRCTVTSSGSGFLINSGAASPVGP